MIHFLALLPRMFRYIQWFQVFAGFVRPLWPHIARLWRRPAPAVAG